MQPRLLILILTSFLASSEGLTSGSSEVSHIKVFGGRPLHQAINLNKELEDMQIRYSYMRCVNFQLARHFGNDAYNDREKIFPSNMPEILASTKGHLAELRRQKDFLFRHHDQYDNENISIKEQISVNRLKREVGAFKDGFNTLFDKVSQAAMELGKTSICDRLLTKK